MSRQRSLSWSAALRDLKADRASRPEIREERLRTTAGLRGSPALALSAWRGRSGRRYVVSVHGVADTAEFSGDAVLIAVAREDSGIASAFHAVAGMSDDQNAQWARAAQDVGATEIHVHRLAETAKARADIIADLDLIAETEAV